jgi:hypothetical protein
MKQQGIITQITPPQTFGSYTKRLVIIEWTERNYTTELALEFGGKCIGKADSLNVGDEIEASFNIGSRESTAKPGMWFTSAVGWAVEVLAHAHTETAPQQAEKTAEEEYKDDASLPF